MDEHIEQKTEWSMRQLLALVVVALVALIGLIYWQQVRLTALAAQLAKTQSAVASLTNDLGQTNANAAELARREQLSQKSQDQLLQDAVAQATPAVVSIVETKEVPKLSVQYVDPFGNDPYFGDSGIRIPVYKETGQTQPQKVGAGTGFLIRASGYIATNRHVVADTNATYTVLLADGSQKQASVVWRDPQHDLAIIKIGGSDYHTIALGDSGQLSLGQSVFAVGNALGEYSNSVSVGIISGLNRTITAASQQGNETLSGVIQTDAAINPGNSGGPLVDLSGKAVGINVATVSGSQNISFSIPITELKRGMAQLGI